MQQSFKQCYILTSVVKKRNKYKIMFSICLAFSGFSTNTKYDPYQIKAEIASRRDRVSSVF